MKRPPRAVPVNLWRKWPQKLASNVQLTLYPGGGETVWHKGHTMLDIVHECAVTLAKREKVKIDAVVVFYPQGRYQSILRRINRLRKSPGGIGKFKGLTISSTTKLEAYCVAFLIRDVEAHKTPADAYYTTFHPQARRANPIPLYEGDENFGKEVHR